MRNPILPIVLLLAACTGDEEPSNLAPGIDIISHRSGDRVMEGYSVLFEASVRDGNDDFADLTVLWGIVLWKLKKTCL